MAVAELQVRSTISANGRTAKVIEVIRNGAKLTCVQHCTDNADNEAKEPLASAEATITQHLAFARLSTFLAYLAELHPEVPCLYDPGRDEVDAKSHGRGDVLWAEGSQ